MNHKCFKCGEEYVSGPVQKTLFQGTWVDLVAYASFSEACGGEVINVFKLEDGRYVLVADSACSCGGLESLRMDFFHSVEEALYSFYERFRRTLVLGTLKYPRL